MNPMRRSASSRYELKPAAGGEASDDKGKFSLIHSLEMDP